MCMRLLLHMRQIRMPPRLRRMMLMHRTQPMQSTRRRRQLRIRARRQRLRKKRMQHMTLMPRTMLTMRLRQPQWPRQKHCPHIPVTAQ